MKKYIFLLLAAYGSFGQTVYRVTNGDDLNTMITNANSGDVFLVQAGEYGDLYIDKGVKIIGTGYLLPVEGNNYQGTSNFANVTFRSTAVNASISGLNISGIINVGASQTQVTRCYSTLIRVGHDVNVAVKVSNVLVNQNMSGTLNVLADSENFIVKNNIFYAGFSLHTTEYGEVVNNSFNIALSSVGSYSGAGYINVVIKNNIFFRIHSGYGNFANGILPFNTIYNLADNFYGNSLNTISSNTLIPDFANVYLGKPNNPNNLQEDARYQLAPNSPARAIGQNGTDCGAFGGDDPYVLSGIPSIPSIYQLTVPAQVPQNGTLNIQIKAKTNN